MFGIGMPELIIIFVIALLVFGPKELPKIGRTIGKAMAELRRASDELRDGIQREIELAEREESQPPPAEPASAAASAGATSPTPEEQTSQTKAEELPATSVVSASPESSEAKVLPETPRGPSPQTEAALHPPAQAAETRNA